jgi:fatty acid amide hydrolase
MNLYGVLLLTVAVIYFASKLVQRSKAKRMEKHMQDIADRKRNVVDEMFKIQLAQIKTNVPIANEKLILHSTVKELIDLMNKGTTTSEEILTVYYRRTAIIGKEKHLTAEPVEFLKCLEQARKCDEIRKNTPKEARDKLGLLFGIPISIKDCIELKDLDCTAGLSRFAFKPCAEDAVPVKLLKLQGAIPFVKSNLSQAFSSTESVNHIYGRALNPWNGERTPGGSSGGECGLVASGCSPIGIGSDAGGSNRLTASFTGLYSFRPTPERFSKAGHIQPSRQGVAHTEVMKLTIGPIAKSVGDIELVMRSFANEEARKLDSLIPSMEWNSNGNLKPKMKIAYVLSETLFGTCKSSKRAVREAASAFENIGYDTVEVNFPEFEKLILLLLSVLNAEGDSVSLKEALQGEKPIDERANDAILSSIPNWVMFLIKVALRIAGQKRPAKVLDYTKKLSSNDLLLTLYEIGNLKEKFYAWWIEQGIDAMILPTVALPAFTHGSSKDLEASICYVMPASLFSLPTGVVPITQVREDEQSYGKGDCCHNDMLTKEADKCMKQSINLPIGVQIMTLPWQDEKCIELMKILEEKIPFRNKLPIN